MMATPALHMADVSEINQNLPNPTNPNNVMAMFWDDFQVVYDASHQQGCDHGG